MTTCRSNACRTQHGAAFEVVSEVETFLLQGRDELFGRPALNDRLFLHMGIIGPDTVTWDRECCREIGNIAGIDRGHRVGRAIPRRHGLVLRNQNQESSESLGKFPRDCWIQSRSAPQLWKVLREFLKQELRRCKLKERQAQEPPNRRITEEGSNDDVRVDDEPPRGGQPCVTPRVPCERPRSDGGGPL